MQKTVLVVDDDRYVLDVVSLILEDEGYTALQAASAQLALSLMEHTTPDLILSDAMMPGMDGYTFCQQVRANPRWSQIPFVFLTGRGERADIRYGMGLGADDYITKPFDREELLSAVKVRLARASETQLAISKASADLRDTTLRMLTHEFRTPLTLIVGYVDLMSAGAQQTSDEEFVTFLSGLRMGSERLMNLVEDLLLLSRLQTGALVKENYGLLNHVAEADAMVGQVLEQCASQASARNVVLTLQAGVTGAIVVVDEKHLLDIVRRLVDNAIKFSKPEGGQVTLVTRQEQGSWVLEVADEGIGIRDEALASIFDAFYQADRDKMEQQGAGLGLAIVRGLVELYGGRVAAKSRPGGGSALTVYLPLALPSGGRVLLTP